MAARAPARRSTDLPVHRHRWGKALLIALLAAGLSGCDGEQLYDSVGPDPGGPGGGPTGPADVAVTIAVAAPDRIELTDSIAIRVDAWDPNGASSISRVGFSAIVTDTDGGAEVARASEQPFSVAAGDTVSGTFVLHPDWIASADLPVDFELEVYGWALCSGGQCGVAIPGDAMGYSCQTQLIGSTSLTVSNPRGGGSPIKAVVGRTTPFPTSTIVVGDLQVDTLRNRAYLSNRLSNRLHLFRPTDFTWEGEVTVGSEPWGMHLNTTGDTLLVANSGGTSVSRVYLPGTPQEIVSARIQTRNTALFEVELEIETDTLPDMTVVEDTLASGTRFFDFSDPPTVCVARRRWTVAVLHPADQRRAPRDG